MNRVLKNPGKKSKKGCFKGGMMKKVLISFIMVMFLCGAAFWSCSGDKKTESKKGAIEKMTDKTGKEIAAALQKPIKSARSVKEKEEKRSKEIEKALKDQ
jgi:hypothetical protein